MNINTLRKHYDTLTPRERLIALIEAATRGDDQEHKALMNSAPVVTYSVKDHYFLTSAIEHLCFFEATMLLNFGCALLMGLAFIEPHMESTEQDPEEFGELLRGVSAGFRLNDAAWRKFCAKYLFDPIRIMAGVPGAGVQIPGGPDDTDMLGYLRGICEKFSPEEPDPAEVDEIAESLDDTFCRLAGGKPS